MFHQLPTRADLFMVQNNHRILGGGFVAYLRGTIFNTWGGMLRQYYHLRPNYLLYWDTLRHGCQAGFQQVDLGRCLRDSGHYRFKKQWTAEPRPLYQQFYLHRTSQPPAVGGNRAGDVWYRLFVSLWRVMPLAIVERLGPWLRTQIPFG
jgi:hypothetical protein